MPLWTCDFEGCVRPAVRKQGECLLCNRHICAFHLLPQFHRCPPYEDAENFERGLGEAMRREIESLIDKINLSALATRASSLRHGMPCSIAPLSYDKKTRWRVMGGMNYHIEIVFEDQVVWLARIRRLNATSPPRVLRNAILESEVATLKFLKQQTKVPVPRVYDFVPEGAPGNRVGVGYMLMEKMPGRSFNHSESLAPKQRDTLLTDLAAIFVELSRYTFDTIGSLTLSEQDSGIGHDCFIVGPVANETFADITDDSTVKRMGPFKSLHDYHAAEIGLILELIARREMYAKEPVNAYLIHRFLLEILPRVAGPVDDDDQDCSQDPQQQRQVNFLRHPDDKGDHLLVDDDHHITAIIDWEWAHTFPSPLALNSPIMLFDVGAFYDGDNALSADEEVFARCLNDAAPSIHHQATDEKKGATTTTTTTTVKRHAAMAGTAVQRGRIYHRFGFCCGYDLDGDWDGFLGLFRGLRGALACLPPSSLSALPVGEIHEDGRGGGRGGVSKMAPLEQVNIEWEEWKRIALEVFGDDVGLIRVMKMAKEEEAKGTSLWE